MTSARRKAKDWPYKRYSEYERQMRKVATEWFASKELEVQKKYSFILSEWKDWPNNIILAEVSEGIQQEQEKRVSAGEGFPLHKYLHHGLSSQAMLFNLIGPLVIRDDIDTLQPLFEAKGIQWPRGVTTSRFEDEDRTVFNEEYGHATSIDLALSGEAGSQPIFIESKLVERKFGGCSVFEQQGDCDGSNPAGDFKQCYLFHIDRQYWQQMKQHGFLDGPLGKGAICPLASYYQFFREVIYSVHKGGYFVLLHDERNPSFISKTAGQPDRGTYTFLTSLLPESLKDRVKSVTIQEVFEEIRKSSNHQDWTDEFAAKYGLDSSAQ